jgi:hypothetical protein
LKYKGVGFYLANQRRVDDSASEEFQIFAKIFIAQKPGSGFAF